MRKDFETEYSSIVSNKAFPSYVDYEDKRYKTIFISKNKSLVLWKIADTYVDKQGEDYYIHNIFSEFSYGYSYPFNKATLRFHKKLKIYRCDSGWFINVEGSRGYIGSPENYM